MKAHDDLMKKWADQELHKGRHFIMDGIIDADRWAKSPIKTVALLKEAYGGYDNICSLIKDEWAGPKYKLWWTVSYWLYAINEISGCRVPIAPGNNEAYDKCRDYLLASAVINIKKSNGNSTSNMEDLGKYAEADKELLKQQVDFIKPNVIICCNTFELLKKFWGSDLVSIGKTGYLYKSGGYLLIDYWHPANYYPDHLCFYGLCSILSESSEFVDTILALKNNP